MSSSALRREATPAAEIIFCKRSMVRLFLPKGLKPLISYSLYGTIRLRSGQAFEAVPLQSRHGLNSADLRDTSLGFYCFGGSVVLILRNLLRCFFRGCFSGGAGRSRSGD